MTQFNDEETQTPVEDSGIQVPSNPSGNIGFSLSAIGILGWIVTLMLILMVGVKKDPTVPLSEPFFYLVQVMVGMAGMFTCGVLSIAGLAISMTGLGHPNRSNALNGVVAGILGLVIAIGIVIWRVFVWREFL